MARRCLDEENGDASAEASIEASWSAALQRCVATRSCGMVELAVVLVFVTAPQAFHPMHALLCHAPCDEPLIVVLRLHPQVTMLLSMLQSRIADAAHAERIVYGVVESLLWVQLESVVSMPNAQALTTARVDLMPYLATRIMNLDGSALCVYANDEPGALHALAMITMAMDADDSDLFPDDPDIRFVVVVEHRDGYVGRRYSGGSSLSTRLSSQSSPNHPGEILSRIYRVTRDHWDPDMASEQSLDDVLEAYDVADREDQDITGRGRDNQLLDLHVNAGFIVIGDEHDRLGQAASVSEDFMFEEVSSTAKNKESCGGQGTAYLPAVCLISTWSGIENVRGLLSTPPVHASSMLCVSLEPRRNDCSHVLDKHRSTVELLGILEDIRQSGDITAPWPGNPGDGDSNLNIVYDYLQTRRSSISSNFQRFLDNIDQESGGNQKNTTMRPDADVVEKMWEFCVEHATATESLLQLVQAFMTHLSISRQIPHVHLENKTRLGSMVRCCQEERHDRSTASSFMSAVQKMMTQPLDVISAVVEAGEWTLKRDMVFWLAKAGYSKVVCADIVQAMSPLRSTRNPLTYWEATDLVLRLCRIGCSVEMSAGSIRTLVDECTSSLADFRTDDKYVPPSRFLMELQSFIPHQLRRNIGKPLFWDLSMAFSDKFQHRVRICQNKFHRSANSSISTQCGQDEALPPLALTTSSLIDLRQRIPENLLEDPDIDSLIASVQRHTQENPCDRFVSSPMIRYDCVIRLLPNSA